MELKIYRAATMSEALALVRRELGPDAAVLHTREVQQRRLFGLFSGRRMIEVTASRGVNVPSRLRAKEHAETAPAKKSASPIYARNVACASPAVLDSPRQQTVLLPGVHEQIADLQTMVKELCRRSETSRGGDLPEELFKLFTKLVDADLGEDLARELVERLRRESRGKLGDSVMLQSRIAQMIEADIRAAGPIAITPGRCRVAALVGPTGVGKTTTIAKLAANYRLKEKRRVGLITVDTYRIAAVEQLRTYANIIDLPMQVVSTPKEMHEAVRQMAGMDLVLIDTAGRSPKDEIRLQELKAFISEASTDEVHLVLSSVAGSRTLQQTAERFAAVGTSALILTKLDEATGLGNLLPMLRSSRMPVSYLTNGQNVPDDIEIADSSRLAKLILGLENDNRSGDRQWQWQMGGSEQSNSILQS
ncbi:MAG: flagellar biosynthesis protein FlhF [Thermoguttaceae bacterium]|jgi:flagellar biosynthesis protein FlhF